MLSYEIIESAHRIVTDFSQVEVGDVISVASLHPVSTSPTAMQVTRVLKASFEATNGVTMIAFGKSSGESKTGKIKRVAYANDCPEALVYLETLAKYDRAAKALGSLSSRLSAYKHRYNLTFVDAASDDLYDEVAAKALQWEKELEGVLS